ncbi:hypothetical protein JTB14_021575 [Gonioctena quinquepunctata]|nr:hypothetical protein JTB14_021575 [Gonioctena quinquepunctata]
MKENLNTDLDKFDTGIADRRENMPKRLHYAAETMEKAAKYCTKDIEEWNKNIATDLEDDVIDENSDSGVVEVEQKKIAHSEVIQALKQNITISIGPPNNGTNGDVTETILDKIIKSGKKAATQTHFHSSHNRPGWVALMCADNTTMQWLKSTIKDIKPWVGAELRVVEEAEMPHNEILVAYLPGSQGYSTEKILGLIEAQNESLNATNWRVLRRVSEGPLELLTLSVDHQSAERLRKTGFVINYKFGHTTLRPKSKGTTLDLTSEPATSSIEQSAVNTKVQAEKPVDSAKPTKNVQPQ